MEIKTQIIGLSLLLLSIVIIGIIIGVNTNKNTKDLNKLYNDLSYNKENVPNGGFLISMFSTTDICSDYVAGKKYGKCAEPCKVTFDIGDINKLLERVRDDGSGTNCFAVDTTYLRSDLTPYAFGPYPGDPPTDLIIGIIIDHRVLWNYIACMYIIDSGSVARSNFWDFTADNGKWKYCDSQECWDKYLKSKDSRFLGFAGCGYIHAGGYQGLTDSASTFFANPPTKEIQIPHYYDLTNNYWGISNKNFPYSRYNWREWVEKIKQIYPLTQTQDFIDQQCRSGSSRGDGYRENEVDVIVPPASTPPKNCSIHNSKSDCIKNKCDWAGTHIQGTCYDYCTADPEFEKIWQNAILGVFTNASTNCSSKQTKGCFKCQSKICCCTEEYAKNLVKQLVDNFNKKYNKNIKGYTMNTMGITDFDNANHKLKIVKI
jgi:hypothetical protein